MKKHAGVLSVSSQSLAEMPDILLPLSVVGRHHRSVVACTPFRFVWAGAFFLIVGHWWSMSLSADVGALPERGVPPLEFFLHQAQMELPGSTVWLEHTHDAHIDFSDSPAHLGLAKKYNRIAEAFCSRARAIHFVFSLPVITHRRGMHPLCRALDLPASSNLHASQYAKPSGLSCTVLHLGIRTSAADAFRHISALSPGPVLKTN
jgi:hypothetical protein